MGSIHRPFECEFIYIYGLLPLQLHIVNCKFLKPLVFKFSDKIKNKTNQNEIPKLMSDSAIIRITVLTVGKKILVFPLNHMCMNKEKLLKCFKYRIKPCWH